MARYLGKVPSGGPTCPFERAFTTGAAGGLPAAGARRRGHLLQALWGTKLAASRVRWQLAPHTRRPDPCPVPVRPRAAVGHSVALTNTRPASRLTVPNPKGNKGPAMLATVTLHTSAV